MGLSRKHTLKHTLHVQDGPGRTVFVLKGHRVRPQLLLHYKMMMASAGQDNCYLLFTSA